MKLSWVTFITVFLLGSVALADTQIAYIQDQWWSRIVSPEDAKSRYHLDGRSGFKLASQAKPDCDKARAGQVFDLANLVNALVESVEVEVSKPPVQDFSKTSKKIAKDLLDIGGGHGSVLAENKCFIIASTAFHVLSSKKDDYGGENSTRLLSLAKFNEFTEITRVHEPNKNIGDIVDVISVEAGNRLSSNEELSLVVIKKDDCPQGTKNYGPWRKNAVFDLSQVSKYRSQNTKINSGDKDNTGVYQVCSNKSGPFQQKGIAARMQVASLSNPDRQDLLVLNMNTASGVSGCPVVYRDSKGEDHFVGVSVAHGTYEDNRQDPNNPRKVTSDKLLTSLFSGAIKEKYEELLNAPDLEKALNL